VAGVPGASIAAWIEPKALMPYTSPLTSPGRPLQYVTVSPIDKPAGATSTSTVQSAPVATNGPGMTAMVAVAIAVLKGVEPPLAVVSAVPPLVPPCWSQARNLTPGSTVPVKSVAGTSLTRVYASAASRRAEVPDGVPSSNQVAPPLVVYCQVPREPFASVTAMPDSAPASWSVTLPTIKADTGVPPLAESFLSMALRLLDPDNTGASLASATVIAIAFSSHHPTRSVVRTRTEYDDLASKSNEAAVISWSPRMVNEALSASPLPATRL